MTILFLFFCLFVCFFQAKAKADKVEAERRCKEAEEAQSLRNSQAPPLPPGSSRPSVAIQWGKPAKKPSSETDKPAKKAVPVIGKRPGLGLSRSKRSAEPEQQPQAAGSGAFSTAALGGDRSGSSSSKVSRFGPPLMDSTQQPVGAEERKGTTTTTTTTTTIALNASGFTHNYLDKRVLPKSCDL